MELPVEFDDLAADGEHPAAEVQVAGPQLGQFAPAQPGLDGRLGQELSVGAGEGRADRIELLRGDDGPRRGGHCWYLHAPARVNIGDLIIERGGEDRVEDRALAVLNGPR